MGFFKNEAHTEKWNVPTLRAVYKYTVNAKDLNEHKPVGSPCNNLLSGILLQFTVSFILIQS